MIAAFKKEIMFALCSFDKVLIAFLKSDLMPSTSSIVAFSNFLMVKNVYVATSFKK